MSPSENREELNIDFYINVYNFYFQFQPLINIGISVSSNIYKRKCIFWQEYGYELEVPINLSFHVFDISDELHILNNT